MINYSQSRNVGVRSKSTFAQASPTNQNSYLQEGLSFVITTILVALIALLLANWCVHGTLSFSPRMSLHASNLKPSTAVYKPSIGLNDSNAAENANASSNLLTPTSQNGVDALGTHKRETHKALLIGINYFNTPNELAGCIDDIRNVERVLVANGFAIVDVLSDVDAVKPTRANIESSLRKLASETRAGDTLYVHYSGHGGQLAAAAGTVEPDGKNSTLIPLDFSSAGQIRDAELRKFFFDALPAGSQLFMCVDACHSGTIGDLRYSYADNSFREIVLSSSSGAAPARSSRNLQGGQRQKQTIHVEPHHVAHNAARLSHERLRLQHEESVFASAYESCASADVSSTKMSEPLQGGQQHGSVKQPSYTKYPRVDASKITYAEHLFCRQVAQETFAKTAHEWKARDIVPIEEPSYAPTAAFIVLLSGSRDPEASADTSFDGEPAGACTAAFLCALTGSYRGTVIKPITLQHVMRDIRGILASGGYTQVPCLTTGERISIDTVTMRDLLRI